MVGFRSVTRLITYNNKKNLLSEFVFESLCYIQSTAVAVLEKYLRLGILYCVSNILSSLLSPLFSQLLRLFYPCQGKISLHQSTLSKLLECLSPTLRVRVVSFGLVASGWGVVAVALTCPLASWL